MAVGGTLGREWAGRVLLALAVAFGGTAAAASKSTSKKTSTVVCKLPDTDGKKPGAKKSNNKKSDDEGVRFNLAGACAKLTGGASYTYQQASQTASGLPVFVNKNGTVSSGASSNSVSANIGLETTRPTDLGEFKTSVAAEWSKATDDGTQNGTAKMTGWSAGLDGKIGALTVGYTGSLMSFWEGDFISTANAPGRSANTIVYEHEIFEHNKVAAGLESNLPTTPQSTTGLQSVDFSDPVYTLRWRYESDAATFHLSGLARRADFSASPLLPLFPNTATVRIGWAASFGFKLPVKFTGEDDEMNFQGTYAVDAASYLGITTDLTTYQHTVRSTGPTTGWSAVASFHHEWSEQFESNTFASFVTLRADLLLAKPAAHSLRTGVNLYWKPTDHLKFGIEFGTVDMKLEPDGVLSFFNGAGGRAYIGYLSMSAEL